jgi:uncharacterized repeat protein (TIGR01451 family)
MRSRAKIALAARIATAVQLLALVIFAGSSGIGFVQPAEAAASAATGTLLKTVSLPSALACSNGSILTLVSGRMLGQSLSGFPILLAVGCPNSNVISFLDPNSAGATNPQVGATVVATVTTNTAPPATGWLALAVRPDQGDLIGCGNITVSNVGLATSQAQVYSIPISTPNTTVTPTLLFSASLAGGNCDGLAWDSGDKTIYAAPVGSEVFHFNPNGTSASNAFSGPCPQPVIGGVTVTGSTLFVSCNNDARLFQISKDGTQTFATITPTSPAFADGLVCDPGTFASAGNSGLWARDINLNQVYAFALPLGLCGNVVGGAILPNGIQCDPGWPHGVTDTTDSSGDGLRDCWKTDGVDANGDGMIDFHLQGATVGHHDIYLEIDSYATGCPNGPVAPSCAPSPDVISALVTAFNNAPVANADGTTGVHLHVVVDDSLPVTGALNLPPCTPLPEPAGTQDFDTLKRQFFGTATERTGTNAVNVLAAKSFIFHYMISAPNLSGLGSTSGCSELPGNDSSIALGLWSFASTDVVSSWAGTIMHELGHNLGLRHGGGAAIDTAVDGTKLSANCKPNYLSVMNYAMQIPDRPVPLAKWKLDYSALQLPTLNEGTATSPGLNETLGVFGGDLANQAALSGRSTAYGAPTKTGGTQVLVPSASTGINWDGDKTAPPGPPLLVFDNANNFGPLSGCDGTGAILAGFNDWANLVYAFQTSVDFADGLHNTTNQPDNQEITQEESNVIVSNTTPVITVTKTASPDPTVLAGNNITYTITATNTGPKPATNVIVSDLLPSGEAFVSATPSSCSQSKGALTCNVGTLNVGSSFTAIIVATVNASGSLVNQASVSSDPDNTFFQSNVTRATRVLPNFGGFNPPVSGPPTINQVQSGSVIPVKFSLGADFGLNIFASGSPQSQQVDCTGLPGTVSLIGSPSPVNSPGGVDFNVIIAPNEYHFNWATDPAWATTCRQLSVQLNDGNPPHIAFFKFS